MTIEAKMTLEGLLRIEIVSIGEQIIRGCNDESMAPETIREHALARLSHVSELLDLMDS